MPVFASNVQETFAEISENVPVFLISSMGTLIIGHNASVMSHGEQSGDKNILCT